jgi:hypothetical protein
MKGAARRTIRGECQRRGPAARLSPRRGRATFAPRCHMLECGVGRADSFCVGRCRRNSKYEHHYLLGGLAIVGGLRGSFRFSGDGESRAGVSHLRTRPARYSSPAATCAAFRAGLTSGASQGTEGPRLPALQEPAGGNSAGFSMLGPRPRSDAFSYLILRFSADVLPLFGTS